MELLILAVMYAPASGAAILFLILALIGDP
jgi:hypothetical protein